jgi:heavy metal translocating P-type ATPase
VVRVFAYEEVKMIKAWLENEPKVTTWCAVISAVCLVLSLGGWLSPALPFDSAWPAIVLCGVPIFVGAIRGLVVDHDVKADVLVSLALVASVATGEWFAAGEVAFIMQIGSLLEDYTSNKAREGVESMAKLMPHTAHVVRDGEQLTVDASEVMVGETVSVLAGEMIPVDGVITEGAASVDQSVMTGESIPVDKKPGDEVISGTINKMAPFLMKATSTSEASTMQRMVDLACAADAEKAPIVRLADRWATWLVFIALGCAAAAWAVTGEFARAVTVLVVFCPCAFILATPTAIAAGLANASKHGVLIRSGESIERLARVNCVMLDKTGTLTRGTPGVARVMSCCDSVDENEVLALAASAEQRSEHPLGKAIVGELAKRGETLVPAAGFKTIAGFGASATVDGHEVVVGKPVGTNFEGAIGEFVRGRSQEGATVVVVTRDDELVGAISLSDTLRAGAEGAVRSLGNMGIDSVLLTGDNQFAADEVASEVGIHEVHAELLPDDKLSLVKGYEGENLTCMVGDGVNDALAMSAAFAGVSMGEIGSDVAVESADAILASDDISMLPYVFWISRKTMAKVRQNIVLGLAINLVAVALSIAGVLVPVTAALVHNCGSVLVVVNAALLLRSKCE